MSRLWLSRIVSSPDERTNSTSWGRKEAPQVLEPLDLIELLLDSFFERSVPLSERLRLRLDGVLVGLDAQQRLDPRQQLG